MTTKILSRDQLIQGCLANELVNDWSNTRGTIGDDDDEQILSYSVSPSTGELQLSRLSSSNKNAFHITPCEAKVLIKILKALYEDAP